MKPTAKIDCQINGKYYAIGDEIKVANKEQLIRLNERGFIEPLTKQEIEDYFKKPEVKRIIEEKEEK